MSEHIDLTVPEGHRVEAETMADGRVRLSTIQEGTGQVVEYREVAPDSDVRVQGRSLPLPGQRQTRDEH